MFTDFVLGGIAEGLRRRLDQADTLDPARPVPDWRRRAPGGARILLAHQG